MKKIYFLLIVLLVSVNLKAQVYWLNDLKFAKATAREAGKLIVIDFWASWCGPCNAMDQKLWQSEEMRAISKNFVGLKINTDNDHETAVQYGVIGIPKVVIATATGEVIWETVGFSGADPFLSILKAIPDNVEKLNNSAIAVENDKKDPKSNYELGLAFQKYGKGIQSDNLRNSFLNNSSSYFAKAQKLSKDDQLKIEIELYDILNDVYYGKPAKALKKLEKMGAKPENPNFEQLRHFVLANCYWGNKDNDNFQKEKQLITNKELLAQLE